MDVTKQKYKVVTVRNDMDGKELRRETQYFESILEAFIYFKARKEHEMLILSEELSMTIRQIEKEAIQDLAYFTYSNAIGCTIALCFKDKDFPLKDEQFEELYAYETEHHQGRVYWPGYEGR